MLSNLSTNVNGGAWILMVKSPQLSIQKAFGYIFGGLIEGYYRKEDMYVKRWWWHWHVWVYNRNILITKLQGVILYLYYTKDRLSIVAMDNLVSNFLLSVLIVGYRRILIITDMEISLSIAILHLIISFTFKWFSIVKLYRNLHQI